MPTQAAQQPGMPNQTAQQPGMSNQAPQQHPSQTTIPNSEGNLHGPISMQYMGAQQYQPQQFIAASQPNMSQPTPPSSSYQNAPTPKQMQTQFQQPQSQYNQQQYQQPQQGPIQTQQVQPKIGQNVQPQAYNVQPQTQSHGQQGQTPMQYVQPQVQQNYQPTSQGQQPIQQGSPKHMPTNLGYQQPTLTHGKPIQPVLPQQQVRSQQQMQPRQQMIPQQQVQSQQQVHPQQEANPQQQVHPQQQVQPQVQLQQQMQPRQQVTQQQNQPRQQMLPKQQVQPQQYMQPQHTGQPAQSRYNSPPTSHVSNQSTPQWNPYTNPPGNSTSYPSQIPNSQASIQQSQAKQVPPSSQGSQFNQGNQVQYGQSSQVPLSQGTQSGYGNQAQTAQQPGPLQQQGYNPYQQTHSQANPVSSQLSQPGQQAWQHGVPQSQYQNQGQIQPPRQGQPSQGQPSQQGQPSLQQGQLPRQGQTQGLPPTTGQQAYQQPYQTVPPTSNTALLSQLPPHSQIPPQNQAPMQPHSGAPPQPIHTPPLANQSPAPHPQQTHPPYSQLQPTNNQILQPMTKTPKPKVNVDLLSKSPEAETSPNPVLTPVVITAEDIKRKQEEEMKNKLITSTKDPFSDKESLDKFVGEVKTFEHVVDGLRKNTLKGPTHLDSEWKELSEKQEKTSRKLTMAIAKCYPMKNRSQDNIPYDQSRVCLSTTKDDYINASQIDDLCPSCPKFIVTQAPLAGTVPDFWTMVQEQGTEIVVNLLNGDESIKYKVPAYWPTERGKPVQYFNVTLTLQRTTDKPLWVESIITLSHTKSRQTRSIIHLQYKGWPSSGLPDSPTGLLGFLNEVNNYYKQQRSLLKPIVVHCSTGSGRCGIFCVVYTGLQEINIGHGIIDVAALVSQIRQQRKYLVYTKEELEFCYHALLYYGQDLLMKRGILTSRVSFGDKLPSPGEKPHRLPSEDFILGTGNLTAIQSSISEMFKTSSSSPPPPHTSTAEIHDTQREDNRTANGAPEQPVNIEPVAKNVDTHKHEEQVAPINGDDIQDSVGQNNPNDITTESDTQKPTEITNTALTDLQNPEKFTLEPSPSSKRKITKANFNTHSGCLESSQVDPADPLSQLDAMWSVKGKK
ncbi:unnamed protein product [Owenia fusiformis]|uniref:Uncharacterized protein n=1 Tax=Owenia fusiformis TaxID=6347 RepID=A0A8J1UGW8_OWEFU|nr:unnamed protein product [Owenia fusiformis]